MISLIGVSDYHVLTAENVGRTQKNGIAQILSSLKSFLGVHNGMTLRDGVFHTCSSSSSKRSLSSAASMLSAEVPSILTPISERCFVSLIAVCPPN